MWFFILAELSVFAILFLSFAIAKKLNLEMFIEGQKTLHPIAGLINTLALITSSYVVVLGLNALKSDPHNAVNLRRSLRLLLAAIGIACIYIVVKSWEYYELSLLGFEISTNTFYTLYYFTTVFHFMHVLLGMIILAIVACKMRQAIKTPVTSDLSLSSVESATSYWHMVDMVWVILFPLLYVIQ